MMFCEGQCADSENEKLFQVTARPMAATAIDLRLQICGSLTLPGNGFILRNRWRQEITLTIQSDAGTHIRAWIDKSACTAPQNKWRLPWRQLAYGTDNPQINLDPQGMGVVGGSQPHTNLQPYLCVDFIISLFGIFPSPT